MEKINQLSDRYKNNYEPNVEAGLQRLQARIEAAKTTEIPVRPLVIASRRWLRLAAAVLILAIGVVAMRGWLNVAGKKTEVVTIDTQAIDTKLVTLTDGTKVQLNERSVLTAPKNFKNATKRMIQLTGEAYFDIKPNADKPFEIQAEKVIITVLGTAFNVRAYPGEATVEVEVERGKVQLAVANEILILKAKRKRYLRNYFWQIVQKNNAATQCTKLAHPSFAIHECAGGGSHASAGTVSQNKADF